ncbi:hypothetical protein NLJ89_g3984 [Agrocybe chaxingu]|uniref:F-box domain-containing protein n=1 Tax=Agrocybe chaxingu TaxID=84603 RepID=A0A9W8MWY0_9AGAR|nr:hypothetical protein NLJ89_g3984 [Agrocybe chaxingu]
MSACVLCSTTSRKAGEDMPSCPRETNSCTLCVKLKDLRKEIAAAKAHLAELLSRVQPLHSALNHAHDPFENRLPPEVASRIFMFYVKSSNGYHGEYDTRDHFQYLPFTLGAVCKRWRDIAWATPTLWTTVNLRLDPDRMTPERSQLSRDWLERSRSLPLTLTIRSPAFLSTKVSPRERDSILSIIDAINNHSSRWFHLTIHAPYSVISRLRGDGSGTTILDRLEMTGRGEEVVDTDSDTTDNPNSFLMTGAVPAPTQVSIRGLRFRAVDSGLDWSNVVDVEIMGLFVGESLRLLREATRLVSCKLRVLPGRYGHTAPQHEICHRNIKTFDIVFSSAPRMTSFFSKINLPALNFFECDARKSSQGNHHSIAAIAAFIQRSACLLKHLELGELSVPNVDIIQLLRLTPKLESLHLFDVNITDELLDFIAETNIAPVEGDRFLPCLKSFFFSSPQTYSWTSVRHLIPLIPPALEDRETFRPWEEIEVGVRAGDAETTFIDEVTIAYIDTLDKEKLRVVDVFGGDDFVQASRSYHNRRRKEQREVKGSLLGGGEG